MVTQYNEGDLISFGKYLFSDARRSRIENHPENETMPPVEDRIREVSHADLSNWIDMQSDRKLIKRVNSMCEESLSPYQMEMWFGVKNQLEQTRRNLKE